MMYVNSKTLQNGDTSLIKVVLSCKKVVIVKSYIQEKENKDTQLVVSYSKIGEKVVCDKALITAGLDMDSHMNCSHVISETIKVLQVLLEAESKDESLEEKMENKGFEISPDRFF